MTYFNNNNINVRNDILQRGRMLINEFNVYVD